jgi:hypothetical protein
VITSKKIFVAKTLRIIVLFIQKYVIMLAIIWVWDPGSGKTLFRIPDPESKGTGSATPIVIIG